METAGVILGCKSIGGDLGEGLGVEERTRQ
jgi:hypothetical protein